MVRPAAEPPQSRPGIDDETTAALPAVELPGPPGAAFAPGSVGPIDTSGRPVLVRIFGTHAFFRLWIGQVVSSLGDWLGFFAITVLAARIGGSSPEAAVGLVVGVRILPGFFFSTVAGVLVDRWDRRKVMFISDVSRGVVLAFLPFIDTVWGLVVASFLLEIPTLMWSPAKEASVPNLVPTAQLATANSLSLVAAYGTFPVASLLFASLTKVASWLSSSFEAISLNQETLAIYVDVVTFFVSAMIVLTLTLPPHARTHDRRINFGETFIDLKEGWRFIFINPVVRSVMIGIGTGLVGGGMLVPLGPIFATEVLNGGPSSFGLLLTGLGSGVAAGIVLLSLFQNRLRHERIFVASVLVAGISLGTGASVSTLLPAVIAVAVLGVCAGAVYILGFTILHASVEDELRGRIFSTLYTLVRLCLLVAFALGPFLAGLLNNLSNRFVSGQIELLDTTIELPGVRLTLWLASAIIVAAGVLAALALRDRERLAGAGPGAGVGR